MMKSARKWAPFKLEHDGDDDTWNALLFQSCGLMSLQ